MARKGYQTATLTLPSGKRKYIYAKTKEELEEKVFNTKLQLKMGVKLDDDISMGELIKMWYVTDVEPHLKENSAINLKCILNKHLMPMVCEYSAKSVTPLQVKMWLNETSKLNKNAAKSCFRALKGAFNLAEENGLIYKSPVLDRYEAGGVVGKKRMALTPEEADILLKQVSTTRIYLFVWFALATGARRGEICGLKWDCVDFEEAKVTLRRNLVFLDHSRTELRDVMKTEAGTRVVPLPLDLRDALKEAHEKAVSDFVFVRPNGTPYNASAFAHMWDLVNHRFGPKAMSTARIQGYKTDTVVTPHVLRHTYATRCFEHGMDIKEVQHLMGHSDPSVTLEIYTHYCQQSREDDTFRKAREAMSRTTPVPQAAAEG